MKMDRLPAKVLAALFLVIFFQVPGCGNENPQEPDYSFVLGDSDYRLSCDSTDKSEKSMACQLAYLTNRDRAAKVSESDHALPLDWSAELAAAAEEYSARMCDQGFFDHADPDGDTMEDRLEDAGISWVKAGENLARGEDMYPDKAERMFMDEPPCEANHRGNILDNDFTHVGVGAVFCGENIIYTQLFAAYDNEDLRNDPNDFCMSH